MFQPLPPFSLHTFDLCVPASIAALPSTSVMTLRTLHCTSTPDLILAALSATPCLGEAGVMNSVKESCPSPVGRNARCVLGDY